MENKPRKALYVRESESYKLMLRKVVSALNTNESQFIRDAITEKIERHAKRNPKVAQILNGEQAEKAVAA